MKSEVGESRNGFEQEPGIDQLFLDVSHRFEEALHSEDFNSGFYYAGTDYENVQPGVDKKQPVAVFSLAENHEAYRNNEGIALEIRVPILDVTDLNSGLMMLDPLYEGRFFIVREFHGGQSRAYKVESEGVMPYRSLTGHHRLPHNRKLRTPKDFVKELHVRLAGEDEAERFVLVPQKPRAAFGNEDA